jgi:hypothetical protein
MPPEANAWEATPPCCSDHIVDMPASGQPVVRGLALLLAPYAAAASTSILPLLVVWCCRGCLLLPAARWGNGLAIIQAEFATQLLLQLRKVAAASPSKYSQVAGQLGLLLQLPVHLRRLIETADDFVQTAAKVCCWQHVPAMPPSSSSSLQCMQYNHAASFSRAVASKCLQPVQGKAAMHCCYAAPAEPSTQVHEHVLQVTAARCGSNAADILAALSPAPDAPRPASSANSSGTDGTELLLVPRLVPFSMARLFTPQEGAAYAAAAAAQAGSDGDATQELAAAGAAGFELAVGVEGLGEAGAASSRLVGGRVVGRHRLSQRLLVVGLHSLAPGWQPGQPLQQASAGGSSSDDMPVQHSADAAADQHAQQLQQQMAGAEVTKTPPPHVTSSSSSSSIITGGADLLLPSWAVQSSAAGTSEGAGLGTSRYQLPPVNSDTATHLLQFDGASRGNPGGGARGRAALQHAGSVGSAQPGLLCGLRRVQFESQ